VLDAVLLRFVLQAAFVGRRDLCLVLGFRLLRGGALLRRHVHAQVAIGATADRQERDGCERTRMHALAALRLQGLHLQIVLQLALLLGGKLPVQLQGWADANLGLDCNGFVGNYLFHDMLGNDWRVAPGKTDVEPSSTIDEYFNRWAEAPLDDLSNVMPSRMHLIVRVDDSGHVIPHSLGTTVGHIAITQPNEVMQHSFVTDTMGFYDIETANLGMYGKLALRTVESGGPVTGVQKNWMVFVRSTGIKGVFEVRRDHIHMLDRVRIAPLRNRPS
jgi:hypothetical protein